MKKFITLIFAFAIATAAVMAVPIDKKEKTSIYQSIFTKVEIQKENAILFTMGNVPGYSNYITIADEKISFKDYFVNADAEFNSRFQNELKRLRGLSDEQLNSVKPIIYQVPLKEGDVSSGFTRLEAPLSSRNNK